MNISLKKRCICEGGNPACINCGGFGYLSTPEKIDSLNPRVCQVCGQYVKDRSKHMEKAHKIKV